MSATAAIWPAGAAYIDGRFMPVAEAMIPVTDWGYRRSDVTYDVVSVWDGAFFKLDDHLRRFRASMDYFRLQPRESDDDIRGILHELVRRTGLREAYVAMDCLRGAAPPNVRRHPSNARNYLLAYAVPYVWLMPREVIERGAHLIVASNAAHSRGVRQSAGEELPLGRHDAGTVRGAGQGRRQSGAARSRWQRDRGARVQRVRGHQWRGGDAGSRRAGGDHPALGDPVVREARDCAARCARCRWRSCAMPTRCSSRPLPAA